MRTAGLLMMAVVPILLGCTCALKYRKAQRQIEELIGLVETLRVKIGSYKLPLGAIYADLELMHLSGFCRDLKIMSFGESLLRNRASFVVGEECFERLKFFASMLGKSGCDEQVRNCDALLNALTNERDRLQKEVPKQMKLSLSLGGMTGAMVLLLFL